MTVRIKTRKFIHNYAPNIETNWKFDMLVDGESATFEIRDTAALQVRNYNGALKTTCHCWILMINYPQLCETMVPLNYPPGCLKIVHVVSWVINQISQFPKNVPCVYGVTVSCYATHV